MSPVDGRTTQVGRTDLVTASVTATAQKSERDFFISLCPSLSPLSVFDSEKIRPAAPAPAANYPCSKSVILATSRPPFPLSSLSPIRLQCNATPFPAPRGISNPSFES